MGLRDKNKLLLARLEENYGVDAYIGLGVDDQFDTAVGVMDANQEHTRESIDRQLATGDLGQGATPVGFGTAQTTGEIDFRGSGSTDVAPEMDRFLRAAGMRREQATVLDVESISILDLTNLPNRTAGTIEKFVRGEQIFGEATAAAAAWDSVLDSGNGLGTVPSAGDDVILWPASGNEAEPKAKGKIRAISGTGVLIQLLVDVTARPRNGWKMRANAAVGGALRGYNELDADIPVAIVCDLVAAGAAAGEIWCWVAQGTFVDAMPIVSQRNDVLADVGASGAVSQKGFVWRPDSLEVVEFQVGTAGGASGWSGGTPPVYSEIQGSADGTAPATFAGQIIQYPGGDPNIVRVRVFYGSIVPGAVLFDATATGSVATVQASPAPKQVRGESISLISSKDGYRKAARGCRGNLTLTLAAGSPGRLALDFMGSPNGQLMATLPTPGQVNFSDLNPPNWGPGKAHYLGYPLRTPALSFQTGNTLSRDKDANQQDGTVGYRITSRDPELQVTVQRPGHKGWQFHESLRNATWRCFAYIVGTVPGNILGLVIPRGQITNDPDGEDEGVVTVQLTVKCRRLGGDDDYLLFQR